MEWTTILLISIAAIVLIGTIVYFIIYHIQDQIPTGGGGNPSGGCPNKSMTMVREVFFVNFTLSGLLATDFMVCLNPYDSTCYGSHINPVYDTTFQELKSSFFRLNQSYKQVGAQNVIDQAHQGFYPDKSISGLYDSGNVWFQDKMPAAAKFLKNINYSTLAPILMNGMQFVQGTGYSYNFQLAPPQYTGIDQRFNAMVRNNASVEYANDPGDYYSFLPGSAGNNVVSTIFGGRNEYVNMQATSITMAVYGYKPKQVFAQVPQRVFLKDSWNSTYTSDLTAEILPFSSQYWSFASVAQTGTKLTGQEILYFKINASNTSLVDAFGVGAVLVNQTKMPQVSWDQYQFSYAQGYNANGIKNGVASPVLIIDSASNLFTAWIDESNSSTYGINTKGKYVGTTDSINTPVAMPNCSQTTQESGYTFNVLNNAVPSITSTALPSPATTDCSGGILQPNADFVYWGVKPDKNNWITTLVTPKWQAAATSGDIQLVAFNISGASQWSMYC
uniref:Uncharacterized protein n=1 Tax=viral metagenome TaxID=1070528 RepID=A0A6C0JRD2_9ZZZZ